MAYRLAQKKAVKLCVRTSHEVRFCKKNFTI